MRLSVYDEPGCRKKMPGEAFRVFVDGQQIDRVLRFDIDAGEVWVADTDGNGKPKIDRERQSVAEKRITGRVEVERIVDQHASRSRN